MSSSANVQSIQALEDLKGALGRFSGEAQEALGAAEQEIRRTLDWLHERLNHWQNEVRRRQEEVRQAMDALRRCQASGYSDRDGHYHAPDCSAYERALRQAQARLEEAQRELRNVQQWAQRVQQAAGDYHVQARRLQQLATTENQKAQAFLERALGDLERYLAVAAGVAFLGPTFVNALRASYQLVRGEVGRQAVSAAKAQEIDLVQTSGRGTRDWSPSEIGQLRRGVFPKGYAGHHINNVARFPDLAGNPDNIRFVTPKQHLDLHHGDWRNAASGKISNRKSLIVQWNKFK
jgi:hypothetical protein